MTLRTCSGVSDVEGKSHQISILFAKELVLFFELLLLLDFSNYISTSRVNKDNDLAQNRPLPASGEGGAMMMIRAWSEM